MSFKEYDIIFPEDIAAVKEEMKAVKAVNSDVKKPVGKSLDYSSFINDLLYNPTATKQDRERIVELLLKERDKGFVTEEQVVELIKEYSTQLTDVSSNEETRSVNCTDSVLPKYKSPKDTHDFLLAFNQDPILKYTCHNIDDDEVINEINKECGVTEYDFEKHLKLIHNHFDQLRKNAFVDYRVLALISTYLTGKTIEGKAGEWSLLNIKENWNCEQLHKWSRDNPSVVPNPGENIAYSMRNSGFELQNIYVSHFNGDRIIDFSGLVLYFKSLFHIKADNSLKDILSYINRKEEMFDKCDISFADDFFDNIELFANVDGIVQAYKRILRICVEYANKHKMGKPQIRLSFYDDTNEGKKILSIHHINTKYGKTKTDTISRIGEELALLINKQINGLCDLFIQSKFEDDFSYEINLWDGNERKYKQVEDVDGVKYLMKFYI